MKPAPFDYVRPDRAEEALDVLARHGEDCRIIAGGQSLAAMLNMRLVTPRVLIDISRLSELNRISTNGDAVAVGATVRQADVMKDALAAKAPLLGLALPFVGHYQTRNRGTICGSIAHADPSAELPLALLVSGGSVELRSRRSTRRVAAEDFFVSILTTTCRAEEMVTATHWPMAAENSGHAFTEFAIRSGDYAIVAAAGQVTLDGNGNVREIRLGFGGVEERPRLIDAATFNGRPMSAETIDGVVAAALRAVVPTSDFRAGAAYRKQLVGVLGREVLEQALERAKGGRAHA